MARRRGHGLGVTEALVATWAAGTLLLGAAGGPTEPAARFNSLDLTLSLIPARILPGEPVRYTATLRNPTAWSLPGDLELEAGRDLGLWIRAEGADWTYYDGSDKAVVERAPRTLDQIGPLPAGAVKEAKGSILATRSGSDPDHRSFAFPEAGRYEAKARVSVAIDPEGEQVVIDSRPVALLVEEPVAAGDRAVWEVLRARPESAWLLQHGYVGNWVGDPRAPELVATLSRLLAEFPESRYAPVLREALARHRDLRVRHKLQR